MKKFAWGMLGVLLVAHGCKTYTRNWEWETEYSIFMAGLRVNHRNAKLFNNVGHALEGQGRFNEALTYFQTAVRLVNVIQFIYTIIKEYLELFWCQLRTINKKNSIDVSI